MFDKTGTLTRGRPSVVAQESVDEDKLPILLGLIENSRHPVSVSVASHLKDAGVIASTIPESKSLTGKGVEAVFGGQKLRAGNSRWLHLSSHELVQPMLARGYTVFCFKIENEFVAVYGLEDQLRPDAAETIENLKMRGVSVHVVSGDDDGAVQTLAANLSIPANNVRSRSSPVDKKDYIQKLLNDGTGRKEPVFVFCGDGTNDAVALARATIGIHMHGCRAICSGCGSHAAFPPGHSRYDERQSEGCQPHQVQFYMELCVQHLCYSSCCRCLCECEDSSGIHRARGVDECITSHCCSGASALVEDLSKEDYQWIAEAELESSFSNEGWQESLVNQVPV